jgi:Rieske Fe-S protein
MRYRLRQLALAVAALGALGVLMPTSSVSAADNPFTKVCSSKDSGTPAGAAVTADQPTICKDGASNENPISGNDGVILRVVGLLRVIGGAGATIMIIYSALQLVAANGDSSALKKTRDNLLFSAIGLVVLLIAPEIIAFVINKTN